MNGTPSNACAATSPAPRCRTNVSRSTTAGRSCIDSSTLSGTGRLMSCSTPSNSYREDPDPSRRARDRRHQSPPRTAAPSPASPTSGLPSTDLVLTAPARRCATAPLRLASRALRSPAPSRHAFLFAGAKSHHPDRDSSALVPISNPTTTGPILPQPSQSTLYSSYPSTGSGEATRPAWQRPGTGAERCARRRRWIWRWSTPKLLESSRRT